MRVAVPLFVVVLLVLSGCTLRPSCVDPFVAIGRECCLDEDRNNACDTGAQTPQIPSVDELQRQVDELLNVTETKAAEIHATVENGTNASKETSSNAVLRVAPFAFSLESELAGFTVTERHGVRLTDAPYLLEAMSKADFERLGFDGGYLLNASENASSRNVQQVVLRFNTSQGASDFVEDRRVFFKKVMLSSDIDKLFDETYAFSGSGDVVMVRRSNVVNYLRLTGFSSKQVSELVPLMRIRFDVDKTPAAIPADVYPARVSSVGAGPYAFGAGVLKGTRDSVTLGVEEVIFKKKGADWGDIIGITFVVDNQGTIDIKPALEILVFDSEDGQYLPSADVAADEVLHPGEYVRKSVNLSLSISRINASKTFRVLVTDALVTDVTTVVSVTDERVFNK